VRGFDPRLLGRAEARRYPLVLAIGGALTAALVVAQAVALARLLTAAVAGRFDAAAALALAVAVVARAAVSFAQSAVAARVAAGVKAGLRADLLRSALSRGPDWLGGTRAGELATLAGRGVDALDAYLSGYLPQLVLAMAVPVAVLVGLAVADPTSALIVAVTLPLMPLFAALVGWRAVAATERQWRGLRRMGGHFLDLLVGLPTLRAYDRDTAQVSAVHAMADGYRVATMRTLRIAFLSALVLELVAAVSVALVAVPVGLRLLDGGLGLAAALLVLLLTPEAYLPLRAVGAHFHSSREAVAVVDDAAGVLDPAPRPTGVAPAPDLAQVPLVLDGVTVCRDGREVLADVSLTIRPGERVALVGPSGAGKSTLLALFLGFVNPTSGRVLLGDTELSTVDIEAVRRQLAWVPQRPYLFAGSVRENIALGAPSDSDVREAATAAAADEFIGALPHGYDTALGERGYGLSDGQRQRVALARAFLRSGAPVLLLDEPTAGLDQASEAAVLSASARLMSGRTALVVAHRPALLSVVDRVLVVRAGRVREAVPV
jgi:ATP-binding cassette subfamily C protein CydD